MASDEPFTAVAQFNIAAARYEATTGGCTRELARYLIEQSPPIDSSSHVLDNACGTGIVGQEVLFKQYAAGKTPPKVTCADGAPAMVDFARATCIAIIDAHKSRAPTEIQDLTFEVKGGEDLGFADEQFTHSFTNQGIQFFKDAKKGADEIYRTLKLGGTAFVTSWKDLGHPAIVHEVQKVLAPDTAPFAFPTPPQWFQASHLEQTLRDAGFADVSVHEKEVWYAFKKVEDFSEIMQKMLETFWKDYDASLSEEYRKQAAIAAEKMMTKIERLIPGDFEGRTEELVGIKMVALVGVAKK